MKVKQKKSRPKGFRVLGALIRETDKAALFDYYGHGVWIPIKSLVFAEGAYCAPAWAIDSSKEYAAGLSNA